MDGDQDSCSKLRLFWEVLKNFDDDHGFFLASGIIFNFLICPRIVKRSDPFTARIFVNTGLKGREDLLVGQVAGSAQENKRVRMQSCHVQPPSGEPDLMFYK